MLIALETVVGTAPFYFLLNFVVDREIVSRLMREDPASFEEKNRVLLNGKLYIVSKLLSENIVKYVCCTNNNMKLYLL